MTDHVLPTTLSKSRFKLALQCPRKLAYTSDGRYLNAHDGDELLDALADGGHQVGALARLMFPGGVEVTGRTTESQLEATAALAARTSVVIYEATFLVGGLLARVDVLVKQGNDIQLIEVKSKGFNPDQDSFRGKRGGIASGWREYLYDVAFQQLVLERAQPGWRVRPFLMLIDTRAGAAVEGLGSRLTVERDAADRKRVTMHVEPGFDVALQVPPLLQLHDVTDEVAMLRAEAVPTTAGEQTLEAFVDSLAGELAAGRAPAVAYGRQCRSCEFYAEPGTLADEQRSGWHECMAIVHGDPVDVPRSHTVFGLSNCRYLDRLLLRGRFALAQLEDTDLDTNASPDEITPAHRHRLQVGEAHDGAERFLLAPQIRAALAELSWPLHFVDFETARPVLPFHLGHRPNQQLLFQFSHHTLAADGSLWHARQSLVAEPGVAPSLLVLRELRDSLAETPGSVIHWFDHERSVLKDLARQLAMSDAPDRDSLLGFVASLVGTGGLPGRLFDLGRLVQRTAFFAGTAGRSSIKQVLPAVLRQSALLRGRYAQQLYGTAAMPSLNYVAGKAWWVERAGMVVDPYSLLDPLFADAELAHAVEQGEQQEGSAFVTNGGAAMVAYGQLQRRDLPEPERQRLREQLLRYCELDTLAMVMVYEALADWVR